MALRVIAISAVSTVLSFVGLQFCTDLSLDKLTSDRLIGWNLIHLDNASQDIELPLGLYTTIGLLVNCMINVFILLNLCLKVSLWSFPPQKKRGESLLYSAVVTNIRNSWIVPIYDVNLWWPVCSPFWLRMCTIIAFNIAALLTLFQEFMLRYKLRYKGGDI